MAELASCPIPDRTCSVVLGVAIHRMKMAEVLAYVGKAIENRHRLRLGVVNAAKLVNMMADPELDQDVRSSDLVLADGMSVVWASRLRRAPLPERVAGMDIMLEIFNAGDTAGYRIYLFGAREAVVSTVADRADKEFPGSQIAGFRNGYYGPEEEAAIVETINASRADVLFVAMTSPMKERFMDRWADQLNVPVIHGVGGSFDVYSGLVERAPDWMQNAGLEWLHRLFQEPGRLWKRYLITNSKFLYYLLTNRSTR